MDIEINENLNILKEKKLEIKNKYNENLENKSFDKRLSAINNSEEKNKKRKRKNKKKRCCFKDCNKKLTSVELLTNKCKCNNYFCKKHLLSSLHNCQYNFKKEKKEILKSKNPKIEFDKLDSF